MNFIYVEYSQLYLGTTIESNSWWRSWLCNCKLTYISLIQVTSVANNQIFITNCTGRDLQVPLLSLPLYYYKLQLHFLTGEMMKQAVAVTTRKLIL